MKKKMRSVFVTLAAVMLVLSVSYFALLAPTTAWFYQDRVDTHEFTFGDFDVNQTPQSLNIIAERIAFPGATRFADTGEILFDEAAHVIEVNVENSGDLPAKLMVDVSNKVGGTTYGNTGLRWCVISENVSSFPASPSSTEYTSQISKGSYKSAIEDILASEMSLHDYSDFDTNNVSLAESEYESSYNATAKSILNQNNNTPIVFPGSGLNGSLKKVYVVFWIEYGDVRDVLLNNSTTRLNDYGVSVQLTAVPNVEGASLTITNNYAGSAMVVLKLGNKHYEGAYTIGAATFIADGGEITLSAGQSAVIRNVPVGTYYTISPSSDAYECSASSGTIGSSGASVEIIAA